MYHLTYIAKRALNHPYFEIEPENENTLAITSAVAASAAQRSKTRNGTSSSSFAAVKA